MTTFEDGPAKGQTLMLRRAVRFLRVVEQLGEWDALDQIEDTPKPTETIYAYELSKNSGSVHINRRGGTGGFYAMVSFKLYDPQPADETMRDWNKWKLWCEAREKP